MATHQQRLAAARSAIDYIGSRSPQQMQAPVPNCPGWTVYNAAVHIGRVGVAWHSMILASPDDPDSRVRGYAEAESRGSGNEPAELVAWARSAIDALDVANLERPAYFSMTGGAGTVGLWGWHASSELSIHRLDVEDAVGDPRSISDTIAVDAIDYTCRYFLPAMARASECMNLDPLDAVAVAGGQELGRTTARADNDSAASTHVRGAPVDVLLALWGRRHGAIEVDGQAEIFDAWHALPSQAFQFGTWD